MGAARGTETQAWVFLHNQTGKSMFMIEIVLGFKYDDRLDMKFPS
jgi:hypothetical protein